MRTRYDLVAMRDSHRRGNASLLEETEQDAKLCYSFFPWVDVGTGAKDDLMFLEAHCPRISGIKLYPSLSPVRVADPGYAPFLNCVSRERPPVLVHCGQWQETVSYRFVLGLAERYQRTSFVMAYGGRHNAALRLPPADKELILGQNLLHLLEG